MQGEEGLFRGPVEGMSREWERRLEDRVNGVTGLGEQDAAVIAERGWRHLVTVVESRLSRMFLLELHAASRGGELAGLDPADRWQAFVDLASGAEFRRRLELRYPTLRARLETGARHHVAAVGALAERLAADRPALDALLGGPAGPLRDLALGRGDPHRGGHTVARLDFAGGTVMYKPRPMEIDAALDAVLAALLPGPDRIRTPAVAIGDGYGWTSFVTHRYCADDAELAAFYRNLGHWLAVMRLVGGTDLHGGNIVADGPVPVVVDAETMFSGFAGFSGTPAAAEPYPGRTAAAEAERIMRRAVPRVGILPMRVGLLSGVDLSAAGRLPDEQPRVRVPVVAGRGTDGARLEEREGRLPLSGNHPSAAPEPERFWEHIAAGFADLSAHLRALDAEGGLTPLLKPFLGAEIRQVRRSTQVYGDVGHMLWHPAALHDEPSAVGHARAALLRHARANPIAPADAATIDAEIAELLTGDTPVYTGLLTPDRLTAAVADWRAADLNREAGFIRWALPGVYADPHAHRAPDTAPLAPVRAAGTAAVPAPADPHAHRAPGATRPVPVRPAGTAAVPSTAAPHPHGAPGATPPVPLRPAGTAAVTSPAAPDPHGAPGATPPVPLRPAGTAAVTPSADPHPHGARGATPPVPLRPAGTAAVPPPADPHAHPAPSAAPPVPLRPAGTAAVTPPAAPHPHGAPGATRPVPLRPAGNAAVPPPAGPPVSRAPHLALAPSLPGSAEQPVLAPRDEARRRALAATAVRALLDAAVRGADGSVTWLGPVLTEAGWSVGPLGADAYTGQAGVVVGLAGYAAEARAGRADPVPGLDETLRGALTALRRLDARPARRPGGLRGLGGRVWAWLALAGTAGTSPADRDAYLERAATAAAGLRGAFGQRPADPDGTSGLDGWAGVVVPLLELSEAAGDPAWAALAADIGRTLADRPGAAPDGGLPATAWARYRLALSGAAGADADPWRQAARTAFAEAADAPSPGAGWCRGRTGTALAAADLYGRTGDPVLAAVVRAALDDLPATGRTLCHGAPGMWELGAAARRTGLDGPPEDRDTRLLDLLAAAPRPGLDTVAATAPGLMNGLAGTVTTLLRMHPAHRVPAPLLLAPAP
ncbi:DUF4135 domain-containing protein [Actinacidiphila acididurans]|uniref:DUF4135 domain-containing protein n=1 Tax=Actinacidiphila acididurans TaxID=2784346 RepID=A0ABS2U2M8_9ACTN|nr:DUF4135 domain-containing protein [Actinacidiphila acididurans]MBM9509850.1 DUF4135 domain-containing protein [Actinacidiphila acididurans]